MHFKEIKSSNRFTFLKIQYAILYSEIYLAVEIFEKGGYYMKDLKQNYSTMFTAYNDVVNVNQLAEMLGIGITLAYRLVKQNTIKSIKVGRQYKIPKQNIISYLLNQNVV